MLRDTDSILAGHQQLFADSAVPSLIELLLKFLGIETPSLQSAGGDLPAQWGGLVDQTFGRIVLRRLPWGRVAFCRLLNQELSAGRPVGFMLQAATGGTAPTGQRAWVVTALQAVGQYYFVDLVGKFPELGAGEGHFTEKRSMRVDEILDGQVSLVLYCEELRPQVRPNRWRKSRFARLARMPVSA